MAYVSQEMKSKLSPTIKAILKKYKLKGSLRVVHHSTLSLTIKSGKIDFIKNYLAVAKTRPQRMHESREITSLDINTYWCHEHFSGTAKKALEELVAAMKGPDYFDDSDSQTDYFHCSHYVNINVGKWDTPYVAE